MLLRWNRQAVRMATCCAALVAPAAVSAVPLQVIGAGNSLITVDSSNPSATIRSVTISGLGAGQTIRGFDYRPASPRLLYGLSSTGQLYAINGFTGAATSVGLPGVGSPPITANADLGFDFNPSVDRIRLFVPGNPAVGTLNYRLNPDTGALAATDGVVPAGSSIVGAAYTNNVAGGTPTTLYGIDTRNGTSPAALVTIGGVNGTPSPNGGAITRSVNLLLPNGNTLVTTGPVGFDIVTGANGTQTAYVSFVAGGATRLYTVDLTTGQTTLLGGNGLVAAGTNFTGLAAPLAPFRSMGVTGNQAAVGAVLDQFTGIPNAATLGLFAGIDGVAGTPGAQSAALLQLTPAAYSALGDISLNAVEVQETSVLRYASDLRGGAAMPEGSTAMLDAEGKLGAWMAGGSRFGRYKAAVDRYGADTDEFHFLGGVDFQVMPALAIGGFGGYSKTNAHLAPAGGGKGDLESWFGGGYYSLSVGPLYAAGWISYTDLDWKLARTTTVGAPNTVVARTDGRIIAGGGSVGAVFQLDKVQIEPFGALRYADVNIDDFNELGSGPTGLSVSHLDRVSLRSNVGAKLGAKLEVGGATVTPQVRGSWYHEFRAKDQTINARFLNSSISSPFGFNTTALSPNYYNAGGSLNISGGGPLSFTSGADVQFDKEREFYTLTIGLRLKL
jgi:hypothetical protein